MTWKIKLLIFWNVLGIILFTSLFASPIWNHIDPTLFRFFNHPLRDSQALRLFWALANHRLADWFEDLCILGFYIVAYYKAAKGFREKRAAQLIFCILFTAFTILLINRFVCRDILKLRRSSPTLVLHDSVYLSDFLSWIRVKVDSTKSFPGDHATTALMFACSYAYFVRGKLALLALLYGAFLCLPRLIVGAHWPSDLFVGSGCIVIFSLSWAFCTPLATKCVEAIENILSKKKKKNQSVAHQ
ncbi:MAG: phosphatase PAP2 family protein [Simkaniaceae bacterium]|nr:phosphatase PAP2 family protein [Candidatus Sacchlamyda saccharinae]